MPKLRLINKFTCAMALLAALTVQNAQAQTEITPEDAPEENWLPIQRKDVDLNVIMRIYSPDLEKFKAWEPPKAKKL